jgi:uncharacterized membrane protein YphA (DoxX/SURF4 family)
MKQVRIASRILLGLVFVFSGFVKGIDPMGSAIKFTEYFEIFHMGWLESAALFLSIVLSTAEFLIGVALVIGLRMRVTGWAALLFMSFFTILTFYSAVANPVSDCGCFGDALVLTNWTTFYKNIVLIGFAIFIFYSRNNYRPYSKPIYEWMLVGMFAFTCVCISMYCHRHLPIMDFRPYHIGTHIPSKMIIPEGVLTDQYATKLFYEKNGVVKEFTIDTYPANDSTWKFKDSKSELIKKGYTPPIHGFSITSKDNNDITQVVLADTSYSFIFISEKVEKVKPELWPLMKKYHQFAISNNHKFYILTSSLTESTIDVQKKYQLPFDFYYSDQTTLKTIIRSNPGLMMLKDGVVLGLWHYNDFPNPEYFKGNILSTLLTSYNASIEWKRIGLLLMVLMAVLIVLFFKRQP